MQLTSSRSIRTALTAVTAALLGTSVATAADQDKVESEMLYYKESDRVSAFEGIVSVSKHLKHETTLGVKLTYDALTGSSPNGATPSSRIQTFTRPSGSGQYTVASGQTPLDDTFHDTRFAADLSLSRPLGRTTTAAVAGRFSNEYDYVSYGASGSLSQDLNRRNTTLGLSWSFARDRIRPEGSIPIPLTEMADPGEPQPRRSGSDDKNVVDIIGNVTQVIDRHTIARFNYSFSRASGYLTDPFKILSVVQSQTELEPGEPVTYRYESRPDARNKHALYGQMRRYFGGNTVDLAYRYFWDNWGINSHTVELFYRQQIRGGSALQPHLRWYHQSAADFYNPFLVNGQPLPEHASADYRLASFSAITAGLQYLLPLGGTTQLSLGAEYYTQRGDTSPPEAFGPLRDYELFPNMSALMFRVGLERGF